MDDLTIITGILESSSFDDIVMDLEVQGFSVPDFDTEDEIESHSTNVSWDAYFNITKDDRTYRLSLSGSAIAEISYERWTETYGYYIDTYDVELISK